MKKNGQVMVLGVFAIIAMLGVTGIVIDASNLLIDRNRLQAIADQAAVGGASKLADGTTTATNKALEITQANGISNGDVTITTPYTISLDPGNPRYEAGDTSYDPNDLLTVQVQKVHNYTFGRLFGLTTRTMTATSVAVYPGDPGSVVGVTPLGVGDVTYNIGTEYNVKTTNGGGSSDDGPIRLGGEGASTWRDNMKYGYTGTVSIGASVETKPGTMAGPTSEAVSFLIGSDPTGTFDSHSNTSPRVLIVLICDPDPTTLSGTQDVTVLGYALFWLESVGAGNSIQAKYIGPATPGSWGQGMIYGENGTSYTKLVK